MTKAERLLCELIAIPSVNPAFLPAKDPRAGERSVAEFLASIAAKAGLDITFQTVRPGRANLLARLVPKGNTRQRILLAPHLDTVNASDGGFAPVRRNGRLFGRGACDTKGSVAAMLLALSNLARSPSRPRQTELVFAGLVDEEDAQAGSRALAASGLRADLAIVGEATRLQVVTAHKGISWFRLETRGRSAHGSRPELGQNAIHAMARVVDLLETQYAGMLNSRSHPLLRHPTVNVGTIFGGVQPNIVPDRCQIVIDRRTLPGETNAGVLREISALLRRNHLKAWSAPIQAAPCPAMETNASLPLVAQFMHTIGQRKPAGVDYFSDAAVLAGAGIPSIVFGPGDIAHAHTGQEWISLVSLERAVAMLQRFLQSLP